MNKEQYTKCPFCNCDEKYYHEFTSSGMPKNIICKCGAIGDWYSYGPDKIRWKIKEVKTTEWIEQ